MTALRQLRALLRLRWQMLRSPGIRVALCLAPAVVGLLLAAALQSANDVSPEVYAAVITAAAPAFLGFGVLAVIAPLTAGGGSELLPSQQLVAFPVRPATHFLASLILAPLNLVWVLQLVVLTTATAFIAHGSGSLPFACLTTAAYGFACTAAGQAIAWFVVALRRSRLGRIATRSTYVLLAVAAVVVVRTDQLRAVLRASPADEVVRAVAAGGRSDARHWPEITLALVALGLLSLLVGGRACGWALRRPSDAIGTSADRDVRRRPQRRSLLRQLVATDRASVWRAPALRRGALVLAVLPGVAAAGAAVPWRSLAALPGLVAAGAGLLFGINAFTLDGSGAVWLASLPHNPRLVARAKLIVLTETTAAAVLLAAAAGAVRAPKSPTVAELVGVGMSAVTCTAAVVAICLRLSVRRPHRADLDGPRDAVAPPGAMVAASVRLAGATAAIGIVLGSSTSGGVWQVPVLLGLPVLLWALLSIRATLRQYDDPLIRARVVQVVAAG